MTLKMKTTFKKQSRSLEYLKVISSPLFLLLTPTLRKKFHKQGLKTGNGILMTKNLSESMHVSAEETTKPDLYLPSVSY